MRRNTIRFIVILGTLAILGITITQVFWLVKLFDLREKEFNQNVNFALRSVAGSILKYNKNPTPAIPTINQYSTNYFIVLINDVIDADLLETLLKDEFQKRNIHADFEYSIYDCHNEKMVYGNYIGLKHKDILNKEAPFPQGNKDNYYFAVYFPRKESNLIGQMGIWLFFTFVLLVVIVFFGYALFIILRQKRLSEIQKDFINNMTHEFRTPISTISISSEVLKNPSILQTPERLISYATIIQDEAHRLKAQVERVLQMASLEKEQINLKKESIDMHEIMDLTLLNLRPAIERSGADISCIYKAEIPHIKVDRLHFTNIIHNILDNAIKYCKIKPKILISTQNDKKGITISIEDNGIGISAENQKKIFDKFYRISTGNVHDIKGFGLGLHYVKTIVKAHHGNIRLDSVEGKGSTFRIYLPF